MAVKRLGPLAAIFKNPNLARGEAIKARLTTNGLIRVIRAVLDAVTFGIHLVDTNSALTLEAIVSAYTPICSGVETRPKIKTRFNQ